MQNFNPYTSDFQVVGFNFSKCTHLYQMCKYRLCQACIFYAADKDLMLTQHYPLHSLLEVNSPTEKVNWIT